MLEVLVALLVLSLGSMGAARLHAALHLGGDVARQRSTAVRLAQLDMEGQRAFASVAAASGVAAYDDLASATTLIESDNTVYTVARQVIDDNAAKLKFSTVDVRWPDRAGVMQQVLLHSSVSGSMPATSGALAAAPETTAVSQPLGRHPDIPPLARNLGDGRSIWQIAGHPQVYVFDNRSGDIQARCALASAASSRELSAADLVSCESFRAVLLQGHVRFTLGPNPDTHADDSPLPFDALLRLDRPGSTGPLCEVRLRPTPRQPRNGHPGQLPASGTSSGSGNVHPAFPSFPDHTDQAEPSSAYTCLVPKPEDGGWSGAFSVVPRGWGVGTGPSQYRVCRFSADFDRSGSIDRNEEHPERYAAVTTSLAQQNYLVIRGELSCPHSPPPPHNDSSADTVQHQP